MDIKCFWLERSGSMRISLRRFASNSECADHAGSYHEAVAYVGVVPLLVTADGYFNCDELEVERLIEKAGMQFPAHCSCGYAFTDEDRKQRFKEVEYRRTDTNELTTLRSAAVGAMWDADWYRDVNWVGPDGRCICVKTPGGEWCIDRRASNCTRPDDNEHRCWVRHGTPPELTVDKNGNTCAAGAGSILVGTYHGFLRNGFLVDC